MKPLGKDSLGFNVYSGSLIIGSDNYSSRYYFFATLFQSPKKLIFFGDSRYSYIEKLIHDALESGNSHEYEMSWVHDLNKAICIPDELLKQYNPEEYENIQSIRESLGLPTPKSSIRMK